MSMYDELDARIIDAVKARANPIYSRRCVDEACRLADETGRERFRVIDGRLQALRKAGKVRYFTKAEANGQGGWHLVGASK